MISKKYAAAIEANITAIDWVDRYGGITYLASNGKVTVPLSEGVNTVACFDTEHYKELIPDKNHKSILYIEEANDMEIAPKGAASKFAQTLRVLAWLNLPKCGFPSTSYDPFAPVVRALMRTYNVDYYGTLAPYKVKILKRDAVISIFGKYDYQVDTSALTSWPYAVFGAEVTLTGMLNPQCLPSDAGGDSIECL